MATYDNPRPSSQPVGSTDPAVVKDNFITVDMITTSTETEITNRKGGVRKTLLGLEVDAQNAFRLGAGDPQGDYVGGVSQYEESNWTFTYSGQQWGLSGDFDLSTLPYLTTEADPNNDVNLAVRGNASQEYVQTEITRGQGENIGGKIFPPNDDVLDNGMTVTAGTTHLRVLVGGEPTIVAMSPVASGVVSLLTETTATIDATSVNLIPVTATNNKAVTLYASSFGLTIDGAQRAVDLFKSSVLFTTLIFDGGEYPAAGTPLSINAVGKSIIFESPKFNDDVYFYRCLGCDYRGYFSTSGDVRNIGLLKSKMPSFDCNFWYLQNYAGWGGVNFAHFGVINAKAGQVRQAANTGAVSSINEVWLDGLYCQNSNSTDTPANYWDGKGFNLWIRGAESNVVGAPVYTEDGTAPSLSGTDKWEDAITTSPFTIGHGDMSYAEEGFETWGIKTESSRPMFLLSDFIEGHDHATEGNVIRMNAEDRNGTVFNVSGDFDVITNVSNTQKWGNYRKWVEPIYDNYEFKRGLLGVGGFLGTGGGLDDIANVPVDTGSTSDQYLKVVNSDVENGARFEYMFTAKKTGRIQVGVRGIGLGQIAVKVGSEPTNFGLGYGSDDGVEYYSVASANVTKGETVIVSVYTKAFTTEDTGDVAYITGFGVFYGSFAPTLYQQDLDYSYEHVVANSGVAEDLLTINAGTFRRGTFRQVTIFTKNPVSAGGGEKIVLDVGYASGSSSVNVTVTEVSRTAVNGPGGTSDDSGTLSISTTTSGTSFTVVGTLAGVATVNVTSRIGEAESAIL